MAFKKHLCNITQQKKRHERHYYSWFLCNKIITNELFIYKLTMELTTWWERSKKLRKGKRAGKRKAEENHEENWQRGEEWGKEREGKKMGEKKNWKENGEWQRKCRVRERWQSADIRGLAVPSHHSAFMENPFSLVWTMVSAGGKTSPSVAFVLPLTLKDRVVITPSLEVNPILIC